MFYSKGLSWKSPKAVIITRTEAGTIRKSAFYFYSAVEKFALSFL